MNKFRFILLAALISTVGTVQAQESSASSSGKTQGVLGPVLLGPSLSLGIPSFIGLGVESKIMERFGASLDFGFLPKYTVNDASVGLKNFGVSARLFPFAGSFFVGLGFGRMSLSASKTDSVDVAGTPTSITAEIDVSSTYFTPKIGWRWIWDSGFMMGVELGIQMPMSSSSTFSSDAPSTVTSQNDYKQIKADVEEAGEKVGKSKIPHLTLVQVGYLF